MEAHIHHDSVNSDNTDNTNNIDRAISIEKQKLATAALSPKVTNLGVSTLGRDQDKSLSESKFKGV